ncbi:hypothetical protein V1504DRAFT_54165 [Lipomyces starkeyi]
MLLSYLVIVCPLYIALLISFTGAPSYLIGTLGFCALVVGKVFNPVCFSSNQSYSHVSSNRSCLK